MRTPVHFLFRGKHAIREPIHAGFVEYPARFQLLQQNQSVNVFTFIVASLACYRATVLIARDACPWRICARLRAIDRFSKLLKCPLCVSIWCAVVIEAAFYLSGVRDIPAKVACLILAMSAISIALDRTFTADITND